MNFVVQLFVFLGRVLAFLLALTLCADVPVYFLIGRHDVNAPTVLTEQYYAVLDAPHREIVWFEHSGHTPCVSESDRFVQVMVETVLVQTQTR